MTESLIHPGRRLGRRPPKRAPALRLGPLLTGRTPTHPTTADNLGHVAAWELGGNDQFGTCGPTSVANVRRQVVTYLAFGAPFPSLNDVFDLYRRSGNPRFDPALAPDDPRQDDNGVDMQTMLEALLAGGIGGHKPLAFAQVDHSNIDELRAAIDIFGGLLYGVTLEMAQRTQTDTGLWDYRASPEWGGHAILAGRYTSSPRGEDIAVVTWAAVVGTTDAFEQRQLDEAWVVIWPEHLTSAAFQQGVDLAALAAAFADLTGRPFPTVDPPAPAPSPSPAPDKGPLAELAALWRKEVSAVEAWLKARGL